MRPRFRVYGSQLGLRNHVRHLSRVIVVIRLRLRFLHLAQLRALVALCPLPTWQKREPGGCRRGHRRRNRAVLLVVGRELGKEAALLRLLLRRWLELLRRVQHLRPLLLVLIQPDVLKALALALLHGGWRLAIEEALAGHAREASRVHGSAGGEGVLIDYWGLRADVLWSGVLAFALCNFKFGALHRAILAMTYEGPAVGIEGLP